MCPLHLRWPRASPPSARPQANINGRVLAQCNIEELKKEMNMNFGDWHLFRSAVRLCSRRPGSRAGRAPAEAEGLCVLKGTEDACGHLPLRVLRAGTQPDGRPRPSPGEARSSPSLPSVASPPPKLRPWPPSVLVRPARPSQWSPVSPRCLTPHSCGPHPSVPRTRPLPASGQDPPSRLTEPRPWLLPQPSPPAGPCS